MGVDPSVRDETEKVESRTMGSGLLHGVDDSGLVLEIVLFDIYNVSQGTEDVVEPTLINLDDILPYDSSGSNVQVSASQRQEVALRRSFGLTQPQSFP